MSVYFAACRDYVKVGHSINVMQRVASLASDYTKRPADLELGQPLELLGWFPGSKRDELLAHAALNDFWVIGEWYRDAPEVRAYLANHDEALVVADVSAAAMLAVVRGMAVEHARKLFPMGEPR